MFSSKDTENRRRKKCGQSPQLKVHSKNINPMTIETCVIRENFRTTKKASLLQ